MGQDIDDLTEPLEDCQRLKFFQSLPVLKIEYDAKLGKITSL